MSVLLNEKNEKKSDKDTKLDVLNIFANVARGKRQTVSEVRSALGGINEWFDDYIASEESDPGKVIHASKINFVSLYCTLKAVCFKTRSPNYIKLWSFSLHAAGSIN